MDGKVYKSTGSWYVVKTPDGVAWNARLKGLFKLDGITSTNPLAVGDEVELEPESEEEQTAIISAIHARHNYINRQSPSHRMQHHIVAANIDQSLLVVTLKEPRTSQGFIDRWLVTCEAYHVPAILLFNKSDLYRHKEEQRFEEWKAMYEAVGYRLIRMSVHTGEGLDEVKSLLQGKISLLSGHSGVGKSSFLNALFPDWQLKTQSVSGWSGKGIHTTTFAEMFDLPGSGQVIDTPGMREFGLVDITKQELSGYFPEMRALAGQCQFNNCLHLGEPGCAVKKAVEEGSIAQHRYISYCTILDSITSPHS
ncbi:ribosome small subunit-dependent GTPase A [Puia dinghuensis]|uniref:Small ribosomal subunit biogenesis GTPase RsgA n=1 Tax=Puia dinghuensis TaxID=1792502 RepID=A0A8J2UH09_9BACT|nr:ribosome small subunit-dependent GTPase A [Puia dinghuensis]GGB14047.1 putative ribosome biogenesis GTPase RsgA [Puia dinghuensis]